MKSYALALLLGGVSSKNLNPESSIFDEEIEASSVCGDSWTRWNDPSNSWDTYKKAYLGKSLHVDHDFQANMMQMYTKEAYPTGNDAAQYERGVTSFQRPKAIYPGEEVSLMGSLGGFSPHGIKQGRIGDCWFLAGTAAIAENPERMNQVVHKDSRKDYNPTGVFRYFFWVQKEWVAINIDDQLPVGYKYSNSKDYFSPYGVDRSNFGAWWMPLFEKAYAKFQGSYDRIVAGLGYESLRQLSARPVFYFEHDKIKSHEADEFALFHRMAKENHPMVTSCCSVQGKAPDGLVNGHAYTLLDVVEVQGTRLAKIRNPWSKEGYNGPWSDNDTRWTPALLKQVGHTLGNDGIFFMPFHSFLNKPYFRSTEVAIYNEFTRTQIYSVTQKVQQMSFIVKVPSKQVVYITLEGPNPRFKKNCKSGKQQVSVGTFLNKGTRYTGNLIFPQGYMGNSLYHVTVGKPDYELDAGTYHLMVYNFGGKQPLDYSLTVYQQGSGVVSVKY